MTPSPAGFVLAGLSSPRELSGNSTKDAYHFHPTMGWQQLICPQNIERNMCEGAMGDIAEATTVVTKEMLENRITAQRQRVQDLFKARRFEKMPEVQHELTRLERALVLLKGRDKR